jgi:hypothetical protein
MEWLMVLKAVIANLPEVLTGIVALLEAVGRARGRGSPIAGAVRLSVGKSSRSGY